MLYLIPLLTSFFDALRGGLFSNYWTREIFSSTVCSFLEWILIVFGLFYVSDLNLDHNFYVVISLAVLFSKSGYGTWYSMGHETPVYASKHNRDDIVVEFLLSLIFNYKISDRKEFIANLLQLKFRIYCIVAMILRGMMFTLPICIYMYVLTSKVEFLLLGLTGMVTFPLAYELPWIIVKDGRIRASEAIRGFFFGMLPLMSSFIC